MNKKLFLSVLGVASALALTACGGGNTPATPSSSARQSLTGEVDLTVWCADAIVELTTTQLGAVKQAMAADDIYKGVTVNFTVAPMGEGEAATAVIQDPSAAADVYCFAQDQLNRLINAGGLARLGGSTVTELTARNDAGSVAAATSKGNMYAYPLTSDNGYFMYYDKTVIAENHVDSMVDILADAAAANKTVNFEMGSAWYNFSYFYAFGADSEWSTDDEGHPVYQDTYNTAAGLKAAKAMKTLATASNYVSGSSAAGFASGAAVVVSGTWDYETAVEALGDNLGITDLPSVTDGTETKHLASFGGFKLMGVKPQTDGTKLAVAQYVANYLTGEQAQLERFNARAWGPSNKNAQNNDAVKANPGLAALAKQSEFAKPQGQFPDGWWPVAGAIGTSIQNLGPDATDAQLQAVLAAYEAALPNIE